MKILNVVSSKDSISEIGKMPIKNYTKRFALYKMYKKCEDTLSFFSTQERELAEKYGKVEEDGRVIFNSNDDAKKFADERQKILDVEIDDFPDEVVLTESDVEGCSISVGTMVSLEGLVKFE